MSNHIPNINFCEHPYRNGSEETLSVSKTLFCDIPVHVCLYLMTPTVFYKFDSILFHTRMVMESGLYNLCSVIVEY